jgi:Spy/CpxP family protein refolding chaperone
LRTSTVTISITIALIAGLAIGFAGTTLAYRHRLLRVPGRGPLERMVQTLNLTPAQSEQVGEVMEETHTKMRDLHDQFRRQRRHTLIAAYGQIRELLTPEQQRRFDQDFVPPKLRSRIAMEGIKPRAGTPSPNASANPQTAPPVSDLP